MSYLLLSYGDENSQQLHSCQIELSTQGDIKFGKQYHGCTHQGQTSVARAREQDQKVQQHQQQPCTNKEET